MHKTTQRKMGDRNASASLAYRHPIKHRIPSGLVANSIDLPYGVLSFMPKGVGKEEKLESALNNPPDLGAQALWFSTLLSNPLEGICKATWLHVVDFFFSFFFEGKKCRNEVEGA